MSRTLTSRRRPPQPDWGEASISKCSEGTCVICYPDHEDDWNGEIEFASEEDEAEPNEVGDSLSVNYNGSTSTWPLPDNDLEWRLRSGDYSDEDIIAAANILSAYEIMVFDPEKKRRVVIKKIREAVENDD